MREGALELADFHAARERIAGRVHRTPLVASRLLSQRLGVGLGLGFVSMSAGNHATTQRTVPG